MFAVNTRTSGPAGRAMAKALRDPDFTTKEAIAVAVAESIEAILRAVGDVPDDAAGALGGIEAMAEVNNATRKATIAALVYIALATIDAFFDEAVSLVKAIVQNATDVDVSKFANVLKAVM